MLKAPKVILEVKGLYSKTYLNIANKTNTLEKNFEKLSEEKLYDIEKSIEKTNSVRAKFWYYFNAGFYYMTIKRDYTKGIQLQKEFIYLVENEIAIRSDSNIGGTNMQLANAYVITKNYKEALPPALKALQCFLNSLLIT